MLCIRYVCGLYIGMYMVINLVRIFYDINNMNMVYIGVTYKCMHVPEAIESLPNPSADMLCIDGWSPIKMHA